MNAAAIPASALLSDHPPHVPSTTVRPAPALAAPTSHTLEATNRLAPHASTPVTRPLPASRPDHPARLPTTGDWASRARALLARKVAALQTTPDPRRPGWLRVETAAGHGAGKPLAKLIAEQTDIWTFLAWQLGASAP